MNPFYKFVEESDEVVPGSVDDIDSGFDPELEVDDEDEDEDEDDDLDDEED